MTQILRETSEKSRSFTIEEWLDARRLGRTKGYEEIKSGRIRTYRVGRRRFISDEADREWQRRLEAEATEGAL